MRSGSEEVGVSPRGRKERIGQILQAEGRSLNRSQGVAILCLAFFGGQALFGFFAPDDWLIPPKIVPQNFHLDATYHTVGYNWTIANACKCFTDSAYYPIEVFFSAQVLLNTSGELDVGKTVNFAITIGNVEAYLPIEQRVISRNNLSIPNNLIDAVYLTNSVFASNSSYAIIKLIGPTSSNVSGFPTPSWTAKGDITFTSPGDTYLRLDVLYGEKNFNTNINQSNPHAPKPILITTVQTSSGAQSSALSSLRSQIWGTSFGWLMLLGVLEVALVLKKKNDDEVSEDEPSKPNPRKHDTPSDKRRAERRAEARKKGSPPTEGEQGERHGPTPRAPFEPPIDYQVGALNQVLGDWLNSTHKRVITMGELAKVLPLMNRDGINPLFEPLTVESVAEGIKELQKRGTIKEIRDGLILF